MNKKKNKNTETKKYFKKIMRQCDAKRAERLQELAASYAFYSFVTPPQISIFSSGNSFAIMDDDQVSGSASAFCFMIDTY
ncbi:hypothetical protein [Nostoc sp. FACHB-888]|uniref:hypothetical protein n=1 Tax=Nostoc sp. FACHB-888 TaxID=2692842 RepID=UPI0016857F0F|nr:hypothetical protein [Nostoc sp. FACHB-888]MBD2249603.1 hypothetical protein [Nostoc sp. FACHB-888]